MSEPVPVCWSCGAPLIHRKFAGREDGWCNRCGVTVPWPPRNYRVSASCIEAARALLDAIEMHGYVEQTHPAILEAHKRASAEMGE